MLATEYAKKVSNHFKNELGFVNLAALKESHSRGELEVCAGGFVHFHHRRDGQTTIYSLAVEKPLQRQGWGRVLFYRVMLQAIERSQTRIVAKCPEDLESNGFYQRMGFSLIRQESGRKRSLNVWEYQIQSPLLFYCADGGRNQFGRIAQECGWMVGVKSSETAVKTHCPFVDNDWKQYNHSLHLAAVKQHKPMLATARDIENINDLPAILEQAKELSEYCGRVIAKELSEYCGRVIVIPKIICEIPDNYWIGFSVPTSYGATNIYPYWYGSRYIHLLGGSPNAQKDYAQTLKVVSMDGNYAMRVSRYGKSCWQGVERKIEQGMYPSFRLSLTKQKQYWHQRDRLADLPLFQINGI